MIRNEKTGRFESNKNSKYEEKPDYGFYSKKLQKAFDSLSDLRAAEAEALKIEEAKKEEAKVKELEVKKLEEAYKRLNAAQRDKEENSALAKSYYLKTLKEAKTNYEQILEELNKAVSEAATAYNKAVEEFSKTYTNYNITLHDGDNSVTLKSEKVIKPDNNMSNFAEIDDIVSTFFKLLK